MKHYNFICKSLACKFTLKYMDVGRNLVYNESRRMGFNGTMSDVGVNIGINTNWHLRWEDSSIIGIVLS